MVENPNHVVTHHQQTCQGCGCRLEDVKPEKNDEASSLRFILLKLSKEPSSMIIGHRILNMMIALMLYVTFII